MGDTVKLLQHGFISSIPTIIFVVILLVILERLFFRPIAEVMKKRAEKTVGALKYAREQMNAAEEEARRYQAELQAARQEIYAMRQEARKKVLAEREDALKTARERAEGWMKDAQEAIQEEVRAAKQQLSASSGALASEITKKILTGDAPPSAGRSFTS